MRYIFAAFAIQYQKNLHPLTKDVLETYVNHRTPKSKFGEQLKAVKDLGGTMFMDSGAFSAWTKGEVINIDEYAAFCLKFQDDLECIASLDVIPGAFGRIPTKAEVDRSAEKGFENYLYLLEKGLDKNKLLHIFHQGEDMFWLEEIIKTCPYFGISPANDRTTEQKIQWLEQCMRIACDKDGLPRGKWHGFGVTSWDIMYRYPWYCMTDEHQVLTKEGWKGKDEVKVGDEILSFCDGVSLWEKVLEVPKFDVVDAPVICFDNRAFSARVTPNHRWRVFHQRTRPKWEWKTTFELDTCDYIPKTGMYIDAPSRKKYTDEFVELAAWFWTEGTIGKRKPLYKKDSITIYQSKRVNLSNVERIRQALKNSGEKFSESVDERCDVVAFELYGKVRDQLLELFPEKDIPMSFIFDLTHEQLGLFIEVSVLADGCRNSKVRREDGFQLGQKNGKNLDVLQVACLLSGIPSTISGRVFKNKDNHQTLETSSAKWIYPLGHVERKEVKYTGQLWCVRVKSGAFFTRCNDKVYVTGNSCDSSTWLRPGSYGYIYVPTYNHGIPDYSKPPGIVAVSTRSGALGQEGKHINTLTPDERQMILDLIKEFGFTLEELAEHYFIRHKFNIAMIRKLIAGIPSYPWAFKTSQPSFL